MVIVTNLIMTVIIVLSAMCFLTKLIFHYLTERTIFLDMLRHLKHFSIS
jgi:hypothetical protein